VTRSFEAPRLSRRTRLRTAVGAHREHDRDGRLYEGVSYRFLFGILDAAPAMALYGGRWRRQERIKPLLYDGIAFAGRLLEARTVEHLDGAAR
jgi:hypothetical protein